MSRGLKLGYLSLVSGVCLGKYFYEGKSFKGTVSVITSDPPCKSLVAILAGGSLKITLTIPLTRGGGDIFTLKFILISASEPKNLGEFKTNQSLTKPC